MQNQCGLTIDGPGLTESANILASPATRCCPSTTVCIFTSRYATVMVRSCAGREKIRQPRRPRVPATLKRLTLGSRLLLRLLLVLCVHLGFQPGVGRGIF